MSRLLDGLDFFFGNSDCPEVRYGCHPALVPLQPPTYTTLNPPPPKLAHLLSLCHHPPFTHTAPPRAFSHKHPALVQRHALRLSVVGYSSLNTDGLRLCGGALQLVLELHGSMPPKASNPPPPLAHPNPRANE